MTHDAASDVHQARPARHSQSCSYTDIKRIVRPAMHAMFLVLPQLATRVLEISQKLNIVIMTSL